MTLFGTTLDAQQMLSLASLLLMLVFWIMVLRRQKRADRALAERLEAYKPKPKPPRPDPQQPPRGPWG